MDVTLRDIPTSEAIRAIGYAKDFMESFPMKSGIRDGCVYASNAPGLCAIYVYRTPGGNLVCRPSHGSE